MSSICSNVNNEKYVRLGTHLKRIYLHTIYRNCYDARRDEVIKNLYYL